MFKKVSIIVAVIVALVIGVVLLNGQESDQSNQVKITTNIYPAFELVNSIGGDEFDVELVTRSGIDPHDYEPTGKQISDIENSRLFVYFDGIGDWEESVVDTLDSDKVLNLTDEVETLEDGEDSHGHEDEEEHDGEKHSKEDGEHSEDGGGHTVDEHEHGDDKKDKDKDSHGNEKENGEDGHEHDHGFDPHIWLDPVRMGELAEVVATKLGEIDSDNSDQYAAAGRDFKSQASSVSSEVSSQLSQCRLDTIITSHDAFGYLGDRFGFEILTIAGIEPNIEPTPSALAELIEEVEELGISTILFETQVTPDFAELISSETGAGTSVIYSLESPRNDDIEEFGGYFGFMRENGKILTEVLDCGRI